MALKKLEVYKMNKSINISKEEINDFLLFLYFGKNENHIDNCLNRAYRDFNRTLHKFSKLKNKKLIYFEAKEFLKDALINITQDRSMNNQKNFDKWHKKLCFDLKEIFSKNLYHNFYIGQAQKWINMTLKYIFVFQERIKGFENLLQFSHIPIDNIILSKLHYKEFTTSWSRINDYDVYLSFQKYIRGIAKDKTPLEYEFRLFTSKKHYLVDSE